MNDELIVQVRGRASHPQTIYDMARGLSPAPRIYPRATAEQIAATERALGFALPALLKQIYVEVGNGLRLARHDLASLPGSGHPVALIGVVCYIMLRRARSVQNCSLTARPNCVRMLCAGREFGLG